MESISILISRDFSNIFQMNWIIAMNWYSRNNWTMFTEYEPLENSVCDENTFRFVDGNIVRLNSFQTQTEDFEKSSEKIIRALKLFNVIFPGNNVFKTKRQIIKCTYKYEFILVKWRKVPQIGTKIQRQQKTSAFESECNVFLHENGIFMPAMIAYFELHSSFNLKQQI